MSASASAADDFLESPELYDGIYHFKNYARESERLREIIARTVPGAQRLLDVACGTGEHSRFLKDHFAVDGVDIRESYLAAARRKNPAGRYERADMTDFNLNTQYDVVTCLFSAIGYMVTVERMERAIVCMARHLKPEGVLLVEPWFTPERWKPGLLAVNTGEIPGGAVCRMALNRRRERVSVVSLHYLAGTASGIRHYSELLELGLFTRDEMQRAFERAGLRVTHEDEGLMGRGMYLGTRQP